MARVIFGPGGMKSWSGATGNAVYRTINGKTYVQRTPTRRKKKENPTPKQLERRRITTKASDYGRRALKSLELRALYVAIAEREGKPIVSMANRDAFTPPVVEEIDASAYGGRPGDLIAIAAVDDTGVVRVDVTLADADGQVLERGPAELNVRDGWWLYTAQTAVQEGVRVRISAVAEDRPKGRGAGEIDVVVEARSSSPRKRRRKVAGGAAGAVATARHPRHPRHPAVIPDPVSRASEISGLIPDRVSTGAGGLTGTGELDAEFQHLGQPDFPPPGFVLLDASRLLQDARAASGLTQRELAVRAGTSQSVIARIEKGRFSPTVETLLRLVRAAGLEVVAGLTSGPGH